MYEYIVFELTKSGERELIVLEAADEIEALEQAEDLFFPDDETLNIRVERYFYCDATGCEGDLECKHCGAEMQPEEMCDKE